MHWIEFPQHLALGKGSEYYRGVVSMLRGLACKAKFEPLLVVSRRVYKGQAKVGVFQGVTPPVFRQDEEKLFPSMQLLKRVAKN